MTHEQKERLLLGMYFPGIETYGIWVSDEFAIMSFQSVNAYNKYNVPVKVDDFLTYQEISGGLECVFFEAKQGSAPFVEKYGLEAIRPDKGYQFIPVNFGSDDVLFFMLLDPRLIGDFTNLILEETPFIINPVLCRKDKNAHNNFSN